MTAYRVPEIRDRGGDRRMRVGRERSREAGRGEEDHNADRELYGSSRAVRQREERDVVYDTAKTAKIVKIQHILDASGSNK